MRSTRLQDFHIADWLPAGIGLDDVIVALASLATLAMFFAMWQALRPNSAFERRLAQIVERKETLRQSALVNRRSAHRRTPVGFMREAVTRLNLLRSRHAAEARQMLARAGFRSQDAMVRYLFAQISLPFGFGALILVDTHILHLMPLPPQFALVPSVAAVLFGFYAPKIYLRNAADKRAKQLQLALPDGLTDLWRRAGLASIECSSITIRMAYASFDDYWDPLLGGQGPVGVYMQSLTPAVRKRIKERVRAAYLSGALDGPRSMTATAWAVRGVVT